MIASFGELKTTSEVIEMQLGMKPEEFDKQFLAWLDKDIGKTVAGFDEWKTLYKQLVGLYKAKNYDAVIEQGVAIRDLYADYVETGSVYEMLAEAYLAKGDKAAAIAQLDRYVHVGGRDPMLIEKLAKLDQERGNLQQAAAVLERLNMIYPVAAGDDEYHQSLGGLYLKLGQFKPAIREYQAVVALGPVDVAAAHYQLALAYQKNSQPKQAEEEVFLSLEAAPGYRAAQKLLLELNGDKQQAERK